MSPEDPAWRAAAEALDAVREAGGAGGEALLRRSRGTSVRVARGAALEAGAWDEEGVGVLARLADGRAALATGPSWRTSAEVARRAVAMAREGRTVESPRHRFRETAPADGDVPLDPPRAQAVEEALDLLDRSARAADERVVAIDAAHARAAIVSSYLARHDGVAIHQRHATAHAHASVHVRDGLRAATRGEAWAGPCFDAGEMRAFGERSARSAVVHLTGSGAAPPNPRRVLLAPAALAEITFGVGMALLGVAPLDRADDVVGDPRLGLVEDAVDDARARMMRADGTGRALRRIAVIEHGAWRRLHAEDLPWVRPGLGDLARPGWLRLTWSWADGEPDDALVERMGQGLHVESVHGAAIEARTGRWTGAVAGWWVEDGRRRHAVAGVPLTLTIEQVVRGAIAGGATPVSAHPSGTIRAVPLLVSLAG